MTLRYRMNDLPTAVGAATVTIRVKTAGGRTKLTFKLGSKATNIGLSKRFRCALAKGSYRFWVYAVDPAGNTQALPAGHNSLSVT